MATKPRPSVEIYVPAGLTVDSKAFGTRKPGRDVARVAMILNGGVELEGALLG